MMGAPEEARSAAPRAKGAPVLEFLKRLFGKRRARLGSLGLAIAHVSA